MEQSTQTSNIIERRKKRKGRPKGTAVFAEEESKERTTESKITLSRKKTIIISCNKNIV